MCKGNERHAVDAYGCCRCRLHLSTDSLKVSAQQLSSALIDQSSPIRVITRARGKCTCTGRPCTNAKDNSEQQQQYLHVLVNWPLTSSIHAPKTIRDRLVSIGEPLTMLAVQQYTCHCMHHLNHFLFTLPHLVISPICCMNTTLHTRSCLSP